MANAVYPTYLELILGAGLNLTSLNIRWNLVDLANYTFSSAHDFMDDVDVAGAVEGSSANLGSKTVTSGTFDAADTTMTAVSGDVCEALVLAENGGTPATDSIILFLDTSVTGLPVTPNGGDINITHNASGIFAL